MRIIYWNIRAGGGKRIEAIYEQLLKWRPDVIGLCECRATPASIWLCEALAKEGWGFQLNAASVKTPAVNAVMLASRTPLTSVHLRPKPPEPRRWLFGRLECGLCVGVMHAPNFVTGRKKPYFDAILDFARRWRGGAAVIGGDTNTGVPPLDGNPAAFHDWEWEWVHQLARFGWADAFRTLHGQTTAHTWYSPNAGNGYRLDQAYVNKQCLPSLTEAKYLWGSAHPGQRRDGLSDHAALIVDLAR